MATINTTFAYDSPDYSAFMAKALKGENLILSVYVQITETKRTTRIIRATDDEFNAKADKRTVYSYAVRTEYVPRQSIVDGKVQYLTDEILTDDIDTAYVVFDKLADLIRVTKK